MIYKNIEFWNVEEIFKDEEGGLRSKWLVLLDMEEGEGGVAQRLPRI
jgi:hypothetical protein